MSDCGALLPHFRGRDFLGKLQAHGIAAATMCAGSGRMPALFSDIFPTFAALNITPLFTMEYRNEDIRRQDRLLPGERATELLRESEFGVLSMVSAEGEAYGVPVNYVWDGRESLYIHCAPEGRKLRAIRHHAQVSFCIVGRVHLLPGRFTTEYESIVLNGTAHLDLSDEEKHHALTLLLLKLSPNDTVIGEKYAEKSFHRVEIIRIDIAQWSGKAKKLKPQTKQ
jgi:nitroimidazol reductase NimA-like FMN-containing flavoprotein (pyridoxamine 5'-phosphate oxidase superfamily)